MAVKAELARLSGTSLDQGNELDALAKLEKTNPVKRDDLIDRAVAGEKVSALPNPITEGSFEETCARLDAKSVGKILLELNQFAEMGGDLAMITEQLLDHPHLPKIRGGISFAARINGELDKAMLGAKNQPADKYFAAQEARLGQVDAAPMPKIGDALKTLLKGNRATITSWMRQHQDAGVPALLTAYAAAVAVIERLLAA